MFDKKKMSRRRSLKAILGYAGSAAFVSCTHGPLYSKKDNSNESKEFSPETVDSRDRVTKGQALVDLEQNTLTNWELIKALFPLDPQRYHFSGFVLSSHPEPVGRMINQLRLEFDRDPMRAKDSYGHYFGRLRTSASAYLETNFRNIGFTDSTTMGLALLYSGVKLKKDQEVLVCDHDFYSTKESLKLRASRTGANVRYYQLYKSIDAVSEDEILSNIRSNIRPSTRVLALTWVHSDTGLKLPIKLISQLVDEANRSRSFHDRLIMCVDGVHGMGVEALTPSQLGCDFFVAGTHKALFGPRGTGVIWAKDSNWPSSYVEATIPPFFKSRFFGEAMTPGGFHSFDHRWALTEAFDLHMQIGKERIQNRIRFLARKLKEGLGPMPHVVLQTPLDEKLSAGLVCFEVEGMSSKQVVERLLESNIVASVNLHFPNSPARLSPGLLNMEEEVDIVLEVISSWKKS